VKPPVIDPKTPPTTDPIQFDKIKPAPQPIIPPQPVVPVPQPLESVKQKLTFLFYQTDEEQFGYKRPLFADETFYYPASDCEDRSILFSILIRELLGLEVVLLHYPNHITTAVHFRDETVNGDYLMIDNKKFIVCDPTYIGANIGQAMRQLKNVSAEVVKLP